MSPVHAPERSLYGEVQHFDLSAEPHELARNEWVPHKTRDPLKFRGVALHQWLSPVGTRAINRAKYGEPEALARRALATPYTICAGVTQHGGVPVVVLAHPPTRYTNASDAGNSEWLAIGVMGRFPYDEDEAPSGRAYTEASDAMTIAVGAAIDLAVRIMAGDERDPGPFALITHRQAINGRGDHAACPGESVVRMAMQSEAVRRGVVVPDPDLVLVDGFGKPWPASWRRRLPTFAPPVTLSAKTGPKLLAELPPPPVLDMRKGEA